MKWHHQSEIKRKHGNRKSAINENGENGSTQSVMAKISIGVMIISIENGVMAAAAE